MYGDAIWWLGRDGARLVDGGKVAGAQLPSMAARLDRGAGKGLVLFSEVSGVHAIRLSGGGHVDDLGTWGTGSGSTNMVGSIGLQP